MTALIFVLIFGLFLGIHYYFRSRLPNLPSGTEKTLAKTWLLARRIVSFFFSGFCILIAGLAVYDIARGNDSLFVFGIAFTALLLAWYGFRIGMYGIGYLRYDFRDDKPVHEQRKKRYGWRW